MADLRSWTLEWGRQWWDPDEAMCWNPAGAFGELAPARSLHLVPNTAWFAYGLLGSDDPTDRQAAVDCIAKLISLQYDAPGTAFHGTFARFLDWPYPPARPTEWEDYDPNWRQFVGTTFALMLEDLADRVDPALVRRMEASIELACRGEPDGRTPVNYSNPALMRSWLDGWCGRRIGDRALLARGIDFAERIVAEFDRFSAFDEFNSPTYYGIDLYALALWRTFPPTELFATEGARLEGAVWEAIGAGYHAGLRNFCGPYTRSYHPDATRSVAFAALWIWAVGGREHAPLPDLGADHIDHSHDLFAGPIVARLAEPPAAGVLGSFERFIGERHLTQDLPGHRHVEMALYDDLMLGAESSDHDWGGWTQFLPATAHWLEPDGTAGVLWLHSPRRVRASIQDRSLVIESDGPIELMVQAPTCELAAGALVTPGRWIDVAGPAEITVEQTSHDRALVLMHPPDSGSWQAMLGPWKTVSG